MNHEEATSRLDRRSRIRRVLRGDRGAVGTEMAIVVFIVVTIAVALGAVMTSSATNHQACIPQQPGQPAAANC